MRNDALRRTGPHLLIAFLGMGAWALFVNRAHPWPAPLAAGVVQGCLSACLTLVMKGLTEAVVRRLDGWPALVAPPLACGLLSASLLTAIHALAGTPEVGATVAIPVAVSTAYAASYAGALIRARRSAKP